MSYSQVPLFCRYVHMHCSCSICADLIRYNKDENLVPANIKYLMLNFDAFYVAFTAHFSWK